MVASMHLAVGSQAIFSSFVGTLTAEETDTGRVKDTAIDVKEP